ncbi:MAG: hypothetical protein LDL33_01870 [Desulfomonile sp.]|nr:hypothetical protein [Desulfomonile sp.]
MIHIKEHLLDRNTITIDVGGVLDQGTVPVLKRVCDRHLNSGRTVLLNLESVTHITREGRQFVQALHGKVGIANPPVFMNLFENG